MITERDESQSDESRPGSALSLAQRQTPRLEQATLADLYPLLREWSLAPTPLARTEIAEGIQAFLEIRTSLSRALPLVVIDPRSTSADPCAFLLTCCDGWVEVAYGRIYSAPLTLRTIINTSPDLSAGEKEMWLHTIAATEASKRGVTQQ